MSARFSDVSAVVDRAVEIDDVVVTDFVELTLPVNFVEVVDGVVFARVGGRAVDDDFVDRANGIAGFW